MTWSGLVIYSLWRMGKVTSIGVSLTSLKFFFFWHHGNNIYRRICGQRKWFPLYCLLRFHLKDNLRRTRIIYNKLIRKGKYEVHSKLTLYWFEGLLAIIVFHYIYLRFLTAWHQWYCTWITCNSVHLILLPHVWIISDSDTNSVMFLEF